MSESDAYIESTAMIKPFTEEEKQASKIRDRANARPWTMHWRDSCQSEKQAKVINGEVEDHLKLEHKQSV